MCDAVKRNVRLDELHELVDSLLPVAGAFQTLEIRHFVGGSVASSYLDFLTCWVKRPIAITSTNMPKRLGSPICWTG